MSDESKREKEITFRRIREEANSKMSETIRNCSNISKQLGLGEIYLPNIIITYNNKIIALEREFTKAGIDFYDREKCESRFILEQRLQALILKANECLRIILATLMVSKEQVDEYVVSHKKPTFIEKTFKGAKYEPKKSIGTPEQKEKLQSAISDYNEYDRRLQKFSIENDMIEAILFYKVLATMNNVADFDERISRIDAEMQQLGYGSISETVKNQIATQDLCFANIHNLKSVSISK